MDKDVKSKVNGNLITVVIAIVVLAIGVGVFFKRMDKRALLLAKAEGQAEFLAEGWAEGVPRAAAWGQARLAAFSQKTSYKNIAAMLAPSVVSINVESGFRGFAAQVAPVAGLQNAWAGRMGGWGMGSGGYLLCPNCGIRVPHQRGIPAYTVGCPSCGTMMVREGAPAAYAAPQANAQTQPAGQQNAFGGRMGGWGGGYLLCPNCGTQVPQQRGAPAYTQGCPRCGTTMVREGAPIASAIPLAQAQQGAVQGGAPQFRARGRGGSGVIINRLGYILSNHHVVHGARKITVTLSYGQVTKQYPAEIIDESPEMDLVILKIITNGGEQFTPARIGDSSRMSVGDEVLTFGSPYGLQQTMTFGIVSNTRRTLTVGSRTFSDFIQTDAPINPGSSGGPLVNTRGEVIGINTAIYSPTEAFSGIGFAVPINFAVQTFPEFIEAPNRVRGIAGNVPDFVLGQGTPVAQRGLGLNPWSPPGRGVQQAANAEMRPWLGILGRTVDAQTATALRLPLARGVLVTYVYNNSPCWLAGMRNGDVITRVDNRSVRDETMLWALLSGKLPGDKVKLTVHRGNKKHKFRVILSAMPAAIQNAAGIPGAQSPILRAQAVALTPQPFNPENVKPPGLTGVLKGAEVGAGEIEALGMGVEDLAPALALAFSIPEGVKGVIITETAGQAEAAGLLAGDVIKGVNNQKVESITDFIKAMKKADLANGIFFDIYRQGQRFSLTLKA